MNKPNAVGVFRHHAGKFGVWIQTDIDVSGRTVNIDVHGEPIFEYSGDADARAKQIWSSLGGHAEYLPWNTRQDAIEWAEDAHLEAAYEDKVSGTYDEY